MRDRYIKVTEKDIDRVGMVFLRGGSGNRFKYPHKLHCDKVLGTFGLRGIIEVAIITWEAMRK